MGSTNLQTIIAARDLTRIYQLGDSQVIGINHVNLNIAVGELVVIKGNSGSGKSTLLALLGGLDQPTRGELVVAEQDLGKASSKALTEFRRSTVGMVFQTFNLLPTLNVLENVCLPALMAYQPFEPTRTKAVELLDWLGLEDRREHLPSQLSGGEMQRTAIARALINNPAIILADEPTGNLDSRNGQRVIELLAELNRQQRRTVMIATHSNLVDDFATTSICIRDGMVSK